MLSIVAIAVRGFLLLFGAVVLGLSVTLAKHQVIGSAPTESSFGSFAGAFGIIVSAVGLVALWVDKISPFIPLALDALASVFYLAGGIALTVALKGVSSCTNMNNEAARQRYDNKLLNGGCINTDQGPACAVEDDYALTGSRCQRVQADYVFEYLGFIFGVAIIGLGYVLHRKGGSTRASYV
ncbi:hypothetical protein JX265_008729 [Neoarthrinium moseri]|uniref:MARVEL domain-containing protein n=1 Tax=Neoarthrinium moseri TaxID=1658444 RepID=A0A9Q0ALT6_9PEZI|nr:uncharacterized protein JN550_008794 [Neoarthrinium moseri]KAI1848489.1 hypothetical protein JX266_005795 [Neoarthrinium moseri]KAI1863512.1 hypothetical protein JX265_008729 [Neoarthrinium moseri]KAI1864507.1 hypothetical protein JN550_008794 [Neoarthrinium moseri]